MGKYLVLGRNRNAEWLEFIEFEWMWLASLYGAKLLRAGWQVKIERANHGKTSRR